MEPRAAPRPACEANPEEPPLAPLHDAWQALVSAKLRTGLTSLVTGLLFLLALFFSPVAGVVPPQATAAALIVPCSSVAFTAVYLVLVPGPWLEAPTYVAKLWPGALAGIALILKAEGYRRVRVLGEAALPAGLLVVGPAQHVEQLVHE